MNSQINRSLFHFKLNTDLIFGPNSIDELILFLIERKVKHISVIIDYHVANSSYWKSFYRKLATHFKIQPYFKNEKMEPTYDHLDSIRRQFDTTIECLIGVGGGSTLDVAKSISVLVTNKKKAIKYRGFNLIEKPGIPLILVPSTAGSGSEITPFAVFIDSKEKRKFGINSAKYLPILTIIDPLMTVSCPPSVTISSGLDALIHTLESFVAKKHTPISQLFSKAAFPLIFNNLEKVVRSPLDIESRAKVALGAFYAGVALFNSAAGPAGVLSYPLGTLFNVTHGLAGAVFLNPIIEFNVLNGYKGYDELSDLIDTKIKKGLRDKNKSYLFLKCVKRLCDNLKIPKKLGVFGVEKKHVDDIIEHLKLLWTAVKENPVNISEAQIKKIILKML